MDELKVAVRRVGFMMLQLEAQWANPPFVSFVWFLAQIFSRTRT